MSLISLFIKKCDILQQNLSKNKIIKIIINIYVVKKIRIGYVLKSADVGTLFSGRNSENSSHTCMRTPVQIYAHPRTHPLNTHAHPHTPKHTCDHLCTPAHTHAHPGIPAHTRAHPGTPTHTRTHPTHTH